ncbi:phage BR0599 family protein (plasmid) [Halobacteriovorax sp. GFR7]|uniref:phage BR0599 family protein n=1 Tax=unclassified Halobacteriovorax TaxID=2639665 RepID=UPI003D95ACCD
MAYSDYEALKEGARPVELFKVTTAESSIRVCNIDVEVSFKGELYTPSSIRRSELTDSYDAEDSKMMLWTGVDTEIGALFKTELPTYMPTIRVWRGHLVGDSLELLDENSTQLFIGNMTSPAYSDVEAKIECMSLALSMGTVGLRRKFSGNCPHVLYKNSCGVQRVAFTKYVTVTGIVGEVISTDMTPEEDGYYRGGLVTFRNSHMMITNYTGNQNLTLLAPIAGLKVGDLIEISAGCDKSETVCRNRFNNFGRFGGWTTIPTINYFETGIG